MRNSLLRHRSGNSRKFAAGVNREDSLGSWVDDEQSFALPGQTDRIHQRFAGDEFLWLAAERDFPNGLRISVGDIRGLVFVEFHFMRELPRPAFDAIDSISKLSRLAPRVLPGFRAGDDALEGETGPKSGTRWRTADGPAVAAKRRRTWPDRVEAMGGHALRSSRP